MKSEYIFTYYTLYLKPKWKPKNKLQMFAPYMNTSILNDILPFINGNKLTFVTSVNFNSDYASYSAYLTEVTLPIAHIYHRCYKALYNKLRLRIGTHLP